MCSSDLEYDISPLFICTAGQSAGCHSGLVCDCHTLTWLSCFPKQTGVFACRFLTAFLWKVESSIAVPAVELGSSHVRWTFILMVVTLLHTFQASLLLLRIIISGTVDSFLHVAV